MQLEVTPVKPRPGIKELQGRPHHYYSPYVSTSQMEHSQEGYEHQASYRQNKKQHPVCPSSTWIEPLNKRTL